jgi:hypothetical protein
MDSRDPADHISVYAADDAGTLLESLLNAAGIVNFNNAYTVLNGSADTAAVKIQRGISGAGVWNTGIVQSAAMNLARETNAELAVREAKRLAARARDAATAALHGLTGIVSNANKEFRKSMDETFIVGGQWRRSGKRYIKDIITHSTLFQPLMTEQKTVEGYVDYSMEPVEIKTNLNENYLSGLSAFAIQGLIENVYEEVEAAKIELFGEGKEKELISKQIVVKKYTGFRTADTEGVIEDSELITLEDRYQDPGKFGAYIGYLPATRPNANLSSGKESMFYDEGSGELGRLLTEYIYWEREDASGISELSMAPWDKSMWYTPGVFSAPSLRTVAEVLTQAVSITVSMAASTVTGGASVAGMMALMTAVSVSDDLVFNTLDAAGGYKSWDEAGFEFGKSLAINAAANAMGGVFNGVAGVSNGFFASGSGLTGLAAGKTGDALGKVIIQTGMKGLEVAASGTITSALSAVSYDSENGWGYSTGVFSRGMMNLPANMLSSMTSTLASGIVGTWNSGTGSGKLAGFSGANKENVGRLNNLIGGVAGQGVTYALGGDFTLNLLNLDLVSNGKIKTGLLELHLGRDGVNMNFGTGGADVSVGGIISAIKGGLVWGTSSWIKQYSDNNSFAAPAALRALYGFGDKEQRKELWNILREKDDLQTGSEGNFTAKTEIVDGKKVIHINGYHEGMTLAEQMSLAVVLGHEAYRDGVVTEDNYFETQNAVLAHTEMAVRMIKDGQNLMITENLIKDINALFGAGGNRDIFNAYVDENYDSGADFWKVTKGKDGSILKIENDNSNDITFVDERGNVTSVSVYEGGSRTGFIASQLGLEDGPAASDMLANAGYTYNSKTGLFEGTNPKQAFDITGQTELPIGPVKTGNWLTNGITSIKNGIKGGLGVVKGGLNAVSNSAQLWYNSLKMDRYINGFEKVPGDSLDFWNSNMTRSDAENYSEEKNNGVPQCNIYLEDTIKAAYGEEMYTKVFPNGLERANDLARQFADNPNLQAIDTSKYSMEEIQAMADRGSLIIMAYESPKSGQSGHVAFVANSGVAMFSAPAYHVQAVGTIVYLPQSGYGYNQSSQYEWPILSQAGTLTGNVTMNWGTNGWNSTDKPPVINNKSYNSYREYLLDNYVSFYLIKKGR